MRSGVTLAWLHPPLPPPPWLHYGFGTDSPSLRHLGAAYWPSSYFMARDCIPVGGPTDIDVVKALPRHLLKGRAMGEPREERRRATIGKDSFVS